MRRVVTGWGVGVWLGLAAACGTDVGRTPPEGGAEAVPGVPVAPLPPAVPVQPEPPPAPVQPEAPATRPGPRWVASVPGVRALSDVGLLADGTAVVLVGESTWEEAWGERFVFPRLHALDAGGQERWSRRLTQLLDTDTSWAAWLARAGGGFVLRQTAWRDDTLPPVALGCATSGEPGSGAAAAALFDATGTCTRPVYLGPNALGPVVDGEGRSWAASTVPGCAGCTYPPQEVAPAGHVVDHGAFDFGTMLGARFARTEDGVLFAVGRFTGSAAWSAEELDTFGPLAAGFTPAWRAPIVGAYVAGPFRTHGDGGLAVLVAVDARQADTHFGASTLPAQAQGLWALRYTRDGVPLRAVPLPGQPWSRSWAADGAGVVVVEPQALGQERVLRRVDWDGVPGRSEVLTRGAGSSLAVHGLTLDGTHGIRVVLAAEGALELLGRTAGTPGQRAVHVLAVER